MSEKHMWTAAELSKVKDETDWERVRALTDQDIEAAMRDDPAWADLIDFDWSDAEMIDPAKNAEHVGLELDADLYAFLTERGDLQPQINGILRRFVEQVRKRDAAE